MHLVTVNDAAGNPAYTYDLDMPMNTVDDGLAFLQSQISFAEQRIYETKYRNIIYQMLVPVETDLPEWAESFTYYHYDAVTMGKFLGANAKDLPESDISAGRTTEPLFYGGNASRYSLDELRVSQQLRMPVDVTKQQISYRGFQEHAQQVAFFGDTARGITGLFNNANVQLDNSTTDWDTATADEITQDANEVLANVWTGSKEVHLPGRLLLPSSRWSYAATTRIVAGDTSTVTILEFLRMNNLYTARTGQPLDILPVLELETAGAVGGQRMMAYELTPENLVMKMPIMWRQIAPQPQGLTVYIPNEYKFGGVAFRYPGAAAYRDFI